VAIFRFNVDGTVGKTTMDPSVRNFLYRNPQYYEIVYPEPNEDTPKMCQRMFARYLLTPPSSILDLGCGTGRDLDVLSRSCQDCWGVDALTEMIDFARKERPHLRLSVGDMRSIRLNRTFDVILCMGSAFMYALTNEDVESVLRTFAVHAHEGTLLVVDINNAATYLPGGSFERTARVEVSHAGFTASADVVQDFDRRGQLLVRHRTWSITGQTPVKDYCKYRLFFPAELEQLLGKFGYRVVGMFDNMELEGSDLAGPRLYVASVSQT